MMSLPPAKVQKTTFSDDCLHDVDSPGSAAGCGLKLSLVPLQHRRAGRFERQGDESKYRDVLKTSRMRWGKNRKDVDAGILKLLRKGLKEEA